MWNANFVDNVSNLKGVIAAYERHYLMHLFVNAMGTLSSKQTKEYVENSGQKSLKIRNM
jgi:hypothetical protein